MDLWSVLFDILVLLLTAMVLGAICERLRQSAILGYLAAGTLVGPNALQFINNSTEVSGLAELGVAMLLFTIGLEFSWQRLRGLGLAALAGGTAQVVVTMSLTAAVSMFFGFSVPLALTIGAIVTLSSTAVVLRLLVARAEIESVHGRHALGILLMQDIAVVPLVLMVTVLSDGEGSLTQIGVDVATTLLWACILFFGLYLLFNRLVPRVLHFQSLQRNREIPILLAMVTGLGSTWASHKLGLSPALGAFVAGMLLAESPFATQIRADVASIRTLLVTLFFSSIGMLGDPTWFLHHLPAVLSLVLAVVIGKSLVVWLVLHRFRVPHIHALAAGLCLGQVGEFSFVLAAVGRDSLLSEDLFALVISATITTLFLTPYLVAGAPRLASMIVVPLGKMRWIETSTKDLATALTPAPAPILIIGFGPAGQAVAQAISALAARVTIVDLNSEMIPAARQLGFTGHLGDAMHADVLDHLGITSAAAVVVTIPDPATARAIVALIRSIAPQAHIIVRARYHRFLDDLWAQGAHEVVDEEKIVGLRLAALLRKRLSAEKSLS